MGKSSQLYIIVKIVDGEAALVNSIPLASLYASSYPNSNEIQARVTSIPAVHIVSSWTHGAFAVQFALGPKATHRFQNHLFASAVPLQTVIIQQQAANRVGSLQPERTGA